MFAVVILTQIPELGWWIGEIPTGGAKDLVKKTATVPMAAAAVIGGETNTLEVSDILPVIALVSRVSVKMRVIFRAIGLLTSVALLLDFSS